VTAQSFCFLPLNFEYFSLMGRFSKKTAKIDFWVPSVTRVRRLQHRGYILGQPDIFYPVEDMPSGVVYWWVLFGIILFLSYWLQNNSGDRTEVVQPRQTLLPTGTSYLYLHRFWLRCCFPRNASAWCQWFCGKPTLLKHFPLLSLACGYSCLAEIALRKIRYYVTSFLCHFFCYSVCCYSR